MSDRDELYDRLRALLDPIKPDLEVLDNLMQFVWAEVLTSYRDGFEAGERRERIARREDH